VPWDDLINSLWTELVSSVEEAWLDLDSGFMHPDEERLQLASLPGTMACPPLNYVEPVSYEQELPPAPLSPPSVVDSIPYSGAIGACSDGRYGISPDLKLRLQRYTSYRRQHPSFRIRAQFLSKSSLSSAVTVTVTNIQLFMRRSAFYGLAYFVTHHIDSRTFMSIALATPPRCDSLHHWMSRHGGDSPYLSKGHCSVLRQPGGEISIALGHVALIPCPYSVTGIVIG